MTTDLTTIDLDTVLARSDSILESDLGAEKVMMSIEKGLYYGMNEVGSRIYDRCDGSTPLQAVYRDLLERYEVDEETCREQVLDFARRLVGNGILEIVSSAS